MELNKPKKPAETHALTKQETTKTYEELQRENEELQYLIKNSGRAILIVDQMLGISDADISQFKIMMKLPAFLLKMKADSSIFAFLGDERFLTLLHKYGNSEPNK